MLLLFLPSAPSCPFSQHNNTGLFWYLLAEPPTIFLLLLLARGGRVICWDSFFFHFQFATFQNYAVQADSGELNDRQQKRGEREGGGSRHHIVEVEIFEILIAQLSQSYRSIRVKW